MKFTYDHDLHIHSRISSCSSDPEQTNEAILAYAKKNGLSTICLTDHYWDKAVDGASDWYKPQDFEHISAARPLPKADGIEFLFGCETDMDRNMRLGIPKERFDDFDFVIIPTTHLHMHGFTINSSDTDSNKRRAELWVKRLDALLSYDLPFKKIGIAHLACILINKKTRADYLDTLSMIPSEEMYRLFKKAARLGCGIELNLSDMYFADDEAEIVLRPFRIAKECGCKFYLGSDAHHPKNFYKFIERYERAIDMLGLTEEDKFHIGG